MTRQAEIHDLNKRCAEARAILMALGMVNVPDKPEGRLRQDAQYRFAQAAYDRAESDLREIMDGLTAGELLALAKG